MEYFKELTSDSAIHEYLKDFPENDWKLVIKKTLMYGIHSLKALENLGLASPKLEKIPVLHSELAELKKTASEVEVSLMNQAPELRDKQRRENKDVSRTLNKPRGTSQKQIRDRGKPAASAALRGSSKDLMKQPPFKLTGKEKPEVRRKLPKYLQNIDSKIKEDVLKSKKGNLKGDRSERSDRREDRAEKELKYEKNFREEREKFEWNEKNDEKTEKKQRFEKFDWDEKTRNDEKNDKNSRNANFERIEKAEKNEKTGGKDRNEWNFDGKTDKKEKYSQGIMEEWKNVDISKKKSLESNEDSPRSSSSFSTYHAADEVKEFYQKEFSKLMPFGTNQKW